MGERVLPGSCGCNSNASCNSGDTCIETKKVYDSCRDKECIENLRVYLTEAGQCLVDRAISVKAKKAEIIWIYSDVEPVQFNRGYYSVDLRFFFRITLDVFTGMGRPTTVEGLAVFDKKVILFGSEGNAKTFRSKYKFDDADVQLWHKNNLPEAHIEVVDPIALGARIVEPQNNNCCCCCGETDVNSVPDCICKIFDEDFVDSADSRKVLVTLGLFTIVRLVRKVQLIVPVVDFCIPNDECSTVSNESNPCELFDRLHFPVDEFFPPEKGCFTDSQGGRCNS